MSLTNPWLNPLQRSYQQIKAKLIEDLKTIKDENGNVLITDYSEGNIFILIISLFAGIAEVLHQYIDNMVRESFFLTARKYDSLVKHGRMVDYHPKGAIAPSVDVILYRSVSNAQIGTNITINKGTQFTDNNGNIWVSTKDVIWYANTTSVTIPCVQHVNYVNSSMAGVIITPNNRKILMVSNPSNGDANYENGSMELIIDGEDWTLVETFAFSGKDDKHFLIETDANGGLYIYFGNGIHGKQPELGSVVTSCSYYLTRGSKANIPSNYITNAPIALGSGITCSNPYPAGGGSNFEDFTMLKEHIPLHVRTLGVAITKQDFIDIAMQVPGVNKVAADYECGRKLTLYISPDNGTVASSNLINDVYKALSYKAPLTTWLTVKSAGVTYIQLNVEVTGRRNFQKQVINDQILYALYNKYSIANSEIGGQVRISDIYALIDNLPSVDYLNIKEFYLKPWPITLFGNSELLLTNFALGNMSVNFRNYLDYYITFVNPTTFNVFSKTGGFRSMNNTVDQLTYLNDTINGLNFSILITANNYKAGYRYYIRISEPNKDYATPGYNLPVFVNSSQITLAINEVL